MFSLHAMAFRRTTKMPTSSFANWKLYLQLAEASSIGLFVGVTPYLSISR
jgi:hypothetical protein